MTYRQELGRKAIHIISSAFPIAYLFPVVSKEIILSIVIPAALLTVIVDYGRRHFQWMDSFFRFFFGYVMRENENEQKMLTGGSYVMLAEVIAILIFPKPIAIAGLLTLSIGDSAAALVGLAIGKHRIYQKKTWEGTIAFWSVSTVIVALIPGIPLWAAMIASAAAALVELFLNKIDDNIFIPLASGGVLVLLLLV